MAMQVFVCKVLETIVQDAISLLLITSFQSVRSLSLSFANYDYNTSNVVYNMARIAVGQQRTPVQLGFLRFYTNTGTDDVRGISDAGLLEHMRINGGGIGFFNMIPDNIPSNDANNTARFNILDASRPQLRLVNTIDV
jgi:hypothetical protein